MYVAGQFINETKIEQYEPDFTALEVQQKELEYVLTTAFFQSGAVSTYHFTPEEYASFQRRMKHYDAQLVRWPKR